MEGGSEGAPLGSPHLRLPLPKQGSAIVSSPTIDVPTTSVTYIQPARGSTAINRSAAAAPRLRRWTDGEVGGGGDDEEEEEGDESGGHRRNDAQLAVSEEVANTKFMQRHLQHNVSEFRLKLAEAEKVDTIRSIEYGLLGKLRDGHTGAIHGLHISDDGNLVATGGHEGLVLLWDLEEQVVVRQLRNHVGPVYCVHWSTVEDETVLATAGHDSTVKVWDASTGSCTLTLRDHGKFPVFTVAWSSDSAMLACAGASQHLLVYNMARVKANPVQAKKNSRDMILFDIPPAPSDSDAGHKKAIRAIMWSPDDNHIVSAGDDGSVHAWNVPLSGRHVRSFIGHTGPVYDARFNHVGNRIVTASADGSARVWEFGSGECIRVLRGHGSALRSALFSPDGGGRRVLTAGEDGHMCAWETASGLLMQRMERVHAGFIHRLAYRTDGVFFLSASGDKTVGMWRPVAPSLWQSTSWALTSAWSRARACCSSMLDDDLELLARQSEGGGRGARNSESGAAAAGATAGATVGAAKVDGGAHGGGKAARRGAPSPTSKRSASVQPSVDADEDDVVGDDNDGNEEEQDNITVGSAHTADTVAPSRRRRAGHPRDDGLRVADDTDAPKMRGGAATPGRGSAKVQPLLSDAAEHADSGAGVGGVGGRSNRVVPL